MVICLYLTTIWILKKNKKNLYMTFTSFDIYSELTKTGVIQNKIN